MKTWLPLALALVIGFFPATTLGAGSLAARVQAAKAARIQQQAAQTPQVSSPTDKALERRPDKPQGETSGRINVADWLNGPHAQTERAGPDTATQSDPPADDYPRVASQRRSTTRSLPLDDPTPAILAPPERSKVDSKVAAPESVNPGIELVQPNSSGPIYPSTVDTPRQQLAKPATTEADSETEAEDTIGSIDSPVTRSDANVGVADGAVLEGAVLDGAVLDGAVLDGAVLDGAVLNGDDGKGNEEVESEDQDDVQGEESASGPVAPIELAPVKPEKEFSPQMLQLRDRIRSCLMYYYQRPESTSKRSPWGVMHNLISYGVDTEILAGRQRVNAIGWLCYNRPCRNMRLLQFDGRYPVPRNGPGYQGHEGQFLSMLALSRVKPTYPIQVDNHDLTVEDLIEYEKYTCRPKSELTFKLIALAHYLPSDATWTSKWGQKWSIPRLIQEELTQPINGACCGGTHRLIGYSMAVKVRQKRGEPLDGQWLRASKYVDSYHKYVIKLQNRDGSFSTQWLKGREAKSDIDRRVQTTGHILEWLVFSLPESELTDPRVVRAVSFLNSAMLNYRQKEWEIGPRGHALRALALYNERVFGDKPGERRALLARRPKK